MNNTTLTFQELEDKTIARITELVRLAIQQSVNIVIVNDESDDPDAIEVILRPFTSGFLEASCPELEA